MYEVTKDGVKTLIEHDTTNTYFTTLAVARNTPGSMSDEEELIGFVESDPIPADTAYSPDSYKIYDLEGNVIDLGSNAIKSDYVGNTTYRFKFGMSIDGKHY